MRTLIVLCQAEKMASASLPRVLCARNLSSALGRTAIQTRAATLRAWRPVSTASCLRWRRQEPVWSGLPTTSGPRVPSVAQRWSSTAALSLQELEEQVLSVLKMFDKVKPEQVSQQR